MTTTRPSGEVDLDELLALATTVARRAGELIVELTVHRQPGELAAGTQQKTSRTDLVTDVDRASEAFVASALLAARPNDAILGEEGALVAGTSGITWVVDPLDGTTNYVYGLDAFAVSIAARSADETLVGVVHAPLGRETFIAAIGRGASLNGVALLASEGPESLEIALIGTGFGYTSERRVAQSALLPTVLPKVRDIRRSGAAALDLCNVGAGRLDGYYEAGLQPWDRAAGLLVATEAGRHFRDLPGVVPGADTLVVGPPRICAALALLLTEAAADAKARG